MKQKHKRLLKSIGTLLLMLFYITSHAITDVTPKQLARQDELELVIQHG